MHREGFPAIGILSLLLSALGGGVLITVKAKGRKKAGILLGCLCLAFWTLFCGMSGLRPAREKARRIACQANLKQICHALEWYAEGNAGAYPPDLRTLFETDYLTDESIYRCPSWRRPNPEFADSQYLCSGHRRNQHFPSCATSKKIIRKNTVISCIPMEFVPLLRTEKNIYSATQIDIVIKNLFNLGRCAMSAMHFYEKHGEMLIQFLYFAILALIMGDSEFRLGSFLFYLAAWSSFYWLTRHWSRETKQLVSGLGAFFAITVLLLLLFYTESSSEFFEMQGNYSVALDCLVRLFALFISIFAALLLGSFSFFCSKFFLSRNQPR